MSFLTFKFVTIHPLNLKTWAVAALCFLFLSSCSLVPKQPPVAYGDWYFKGKMAVRNATEASSFNVEWLQQGDDFQIKLSGPLGQGRMTIKGRPNDVTLIQGDTQVQASSLSSLVYETTQLDLPLEQLQFWVRAEPYPFQPADTQVNDDGLVTAIDQAGWAVSITDYFSEATPRPRKLSFAKAGDTGKLIIREWNTLP